MESLFTTSQTIGAIRDPESILTLVVEQLQKVLTADNVSIAIFNEDLSGGRVSASFPHTEYVGWNITRNGLYYVDRLLEQRGPYVVSNVAAEDGFKPSLRESLSEQGIRSIAFAPLEAGERLFGSIGVDSYALRDFSRDEITLLQLFATQVSTAYDNARLFDASERAARALEQQVTRMESLYVTSLALTKTLDLRELLVTGLKGLVETLGADFGTVVMINAEDPGVADVVAWEGHQEPATSRLVIEDSPFYAQMIETAGPARSTISRPPIC
jgi:transcriptional regulator with GAF, ATPase, and Fis domain